MVSKINIIEGVNNMLHARVVVSRPKLVPFLLYKEHSADIEQVLPLKTLNHELYNLRSKIVIDSRYAQRLEDLWSDEDATNYLYSFYRGQDNNDQFVVVSLKEIKRILKEVIDGLIDKKNKSTFKEFLNDITAYMDDGKEWLMINGQHRDEVFHRMWESKMLLPDIGTYALKDDGTDVTLWGELTINDQLEALTRKHPILFVEELERIDDIEETILLNNIGNAWNRHEQRAIKASYIMSKLTELDTYSPAVKLFSKLGTNTNSYNPKKKGISFLGTQLYYQFRNAQKGKYYTILGINNTTLDKMVMWESEDWTKSSVDEFVTFFKKVVRELQHWYTKQPVKHRKLIRNKVATLRNYFMFRLVLDGRTNHTFERDTYKITNDKQFIGWYAKREAKRLQLRNNLTSKGQKLYDMMEKRGNLDGSVMKSLEDTYLQSNAYTYLLNGTSSAGQQKVIKRIWDDFMEDFKSGKLVAMVTKQGGKVTTKMKDEVARADVIDLDTYDPSEMMAMLDTDKNDIGHKHTPKAKGGKPTIDNLFVQEKSWNRSEQDNH